MKANRAISTTGIMNTIGLMTLCVTAAAWLIPLPRTDAQTDERLVNLPAERPSARVLPPRMDVRVADIGPMETREMAVNARVDGLYAVVETTVVFHNPNARELEGELVFPLPEGAAVCGYALDIDGVLVDGVVVSKDQGRVAFESETRRKVDPGLVEHAQGNLYRTRIYPLPAKGDRRIRLTYLTPLTTAANGAAALQLPLPREAIGKLKVAIEVAGLEGLAPEIGGLGDARFAMAENAVWRVESARAAITPGEDILVALPRLPGTFQRIERDRAGAHHFMLTTMADLAHPQPADPGVIQVLWDASGSRARGDYANEFALIRACKATGYQLRVFRDSADAPRDFATAEELIAAIKAAPCDGGTNLAALAAALRKQPAQTPAHTLLFTDGFDTLSGEVLTFAGVSPVAIVSQTLANREALRQACGGALIDLQTTAPDVAWAEIQSPAPRVTGIKGTGIANVQGIGQPAGGRIQLLGELTGATATVRIQFGDGSESEPFVLNRAEATRGRVLATAWAAARVNQLAPRADEHSAELLALGRSYGLVSPATSLIVLDTLEQWVRYSIQPPASLPDLRRQWQEAMKSASNSDEPDPAVRLENLVSLWQKRVDWWKTDFSKSKIRLGKTLRRATSGLASGLRSGAEAVSRNSIDALLNSPAAPFAAAAGGASPSGGTYVMPSAPSAEPAADDAGEAPIGSIEIKPWDPKVPYLEAIRAAKPDQRYSAYLAVRDQWAQSPAFFLDSAGVFYRYGEKAHARRILTNLAELRIEDAGLLRILAWRLQEAGDLDTATVILRRITKLRPEEPQSFRDLALALAERGRARAAKADLEEAIELFLHVARGKWGRHESSIPILALEEVNGLIAWVERQSWPAAKKPLIPEFDPRLRANLDTDIRVVMSWDADATDMDLHVIEPGGEEAYFGHDRTAHGGLVSDDVTDGYGPEEYLIRRAPVGEFKIHTNYFGSSQQTVVGPATLTATIFINWGRPNEERRVLTVRLTKENENTDLGTLIFSQVPEGSAAR
jgi:Ca-activated chloride channel family protein